MEKSELVRNYAIYREFLILKLDKKGERLKFKLAGAHD